MTHGQRLLNLAQFLKIDILCLQETNIAVGDVRLPALVATAKFHGFKAHLGLKPVNTVLDLMLPRGYPTRRAITLVLLGMRGQSTSPHTYLTHSTV